MANLEHELGFTSTYYFRYPYTFDQIVIKEISSLGHEIGYHYEVLSKTNGNLEKAIDLFNIELNKFREITEITTICPHGKPSRYYQGDLWKNYDFKEFGIIGEAYSSFNKELLYFSDTGRTWRERGFHINDNKFKIGSTDKLINLIESNMGNLYILAHPERWAFDNLDWITMFFTDMTINAGKILLRAAKYRV